MLFCTFLVGHVVVDGWLKNIYIGYFLLTIIIILLASNCHVCSINIENIKLFQANLIGWQ